MGLRQHLIMNTISSLTKTIVVFHFKSFHACTRPYLFLLRVSGSSQHHKIDIFFEYRVKTQFFKVDRWRKEYIF